MKRARLLKLGSALAGALAVGFVALVGWLNASSSGAVREELQRIPSPDGLMDLVVTTTPAAGSHDHGTPVSHEHSPPGSRPRDGDDLPYVVAFCPALSLGLSRLRYDSPSMTRS